MGNRKTAFIAIVGRPNVGKSSILNRLLGQKIAIVSSRPQTTRTKIMGVLTENDIESARKIIRELMRTIDLENGFLEFKDIAIDTMAKTYYAVVSKTPQAKSDSRVHNLKKDETTNSVYINQETKDFKILTLFPFCVII